MAPPSSTPPPTSACARRYTFTGLYSGTYQVKVVATSIVTTSYGVTSTLGAAMDLVSSGGFTATLNNPLTVTVPSDVATVTTADFGYNWSGSIGDYAWYDADGNGQQDPGELPAPNATVVLYGDLNGDGIFDPFTEPILASTVTISNGAYLLDNLPPGDYVVAVSEQEVPAPPFSPNAGEIGLMVATTGTTMAVSLGAGEDRTDVDWGFIEAAIVDGSVFYDVDHNGVYDGGESGLSPVVVTLTGVDVNGASVVLTTTTTAGTGEYKFVVSPGTYTVTYSSADVLAINPSLTDETTVTSYAFSVAAGQELTGFDFGVDDAGSIGDTVYIDSNGNGVQDTGEAGLPNVTLELYQGGVFIGSAATDSSGKYLFAGLPNGAYTVTVVTATVPLNYVQTADPDQPGVPCTTCDNTGAATVSGGGAVLTQDFGYKPQTTLYTVSGTVFNDLDASGVITPGEPGIAGVQVRVTYTDTNSNVVSVVTTVNANGQYTVTGIPAGSNVALNVVPGTLPNLTYTPTSASLLAITNLAADTPNQNFGYQQVLGSISGKVCDGNLTGQCTGTDE